MVKVVLPMSWWRRSLIELLLRRNRQRQLAIPVATGSNGGSRVGATARRCPPDARAFCVPDMAVAFVIAGITFLTCAAAITFNPGEMRNPIVYRDINFRSRHERRERSAVQGREGGRWRGHAFDGRVPPFHSKVWHHRTAENARLVRSVHKFISRHVYG